MSNYSCASPKQLTVRDESYTIPPGHDAWVEGNQPFVGIEVMSADVFAKPAQR